MSDYPALLGVRCDDPGTDGEGCSDVLEADIMVRDSDSRAARFAYILDYATRSGWRVEGRDDPLTARAFCPDHAVITDDPGDGKRANALLLACVPFALALPFARDIAHAFGWVAG